ncbi:hypothetical protein OCOJLMKI_0815 [Methylobacterium iners]|uniref:Uncharacterized protein n=1 Tax=Methylobacterium iners TaxID=418707 RepID=A0ABQ4RTS4_9HYPH|nr:hypothetical protein OCOJLMKI_0815 [Methylobacterium iners]
MTTADLSGHIVLMTGAGRAAGMGRMITPRLAAAGADVTVTNIGKASDKFSVAGVCLGNRLGPPTRLWLTKGERLRPCSRYFDSVSTWRDASWRRTSRLGG